LSYLGSSLTIFSSVKSVGDFASHNTCDMSL
jgi:hypothetical protein